MIMRNKKQKVQESKRLYRCTKNISKSILLTSFRQCQISYYQINSCEHVITFDSSNFQKKTYEARAILKQFYFVNINHEQESLF